MSLYNAKEIDILDGAEAIIEENRQGKLTYNDIGRLTSYILVLATSADSEMGNTHMRFLYNQYYVWIQDIINELKKSATDNLI